jgi:hypothetical protein
MCLLAVTIFLIDPAAATTNPENGRQLVMLGMLFGLIVLILALLVLALLDSVATLRYAQRHHRDLADQRTRLMLEVMRQESSLDAIPSAREKKSQAPQG